MCCLLCVVCCVWPTTGPLCVAWQSSVGNHFVAVVRQGLRPLGRQRGCDGAFDGETSSGAGAGGGGGEEKGEDDNIASPSSSFDDLLANKPMLHKALELLLLHTRTQPQQDQGDAAVATVGDAGDAKALDSLIHQLLRFMQDLKQTKGKTVGRVSSADVSWGMC